MLAGGRCWLLCWHVLFMTINARALALQIPVWCCTVPTQPPSAFVRPLLTVFPPGGPLSTCTRAAEGLGVTPSIHPTHPPAIMRATGALLSEHTGCVRIMQTAFTDFSEEPCFTHEQSEGLQR
jgi:hypothetical protein